MDKRVRTRIKQAFIAAICLISINCSLILSPIAAIGGKPYHVTRFHLEGLTIDRKNVSPKFPMPPAIWHVFELPVAFGMDTVLLPVALPAWLIRSLIDDPSWLCR